MVAWHRSPGTWEGSECSFFHSQVAACFINPLCCGGGIGFLPSTVTRQSPFSWLLEASDGLYSVLQPSQATISSPAARARAIAHTLPASLWLGYSRMIEQCVCISSCSGPG